MVKYTAKVRRGMALSFKLINAALDDDLTVKRLLHGFTAAQHSDFNAYLDWAAQEIEPKAEAAQAGEAVAA